MLFVITASSSKKRTRSWLHMTLSICFYQRWHYCQKLSAIQVLHQILCKADELSHWIVVHLKRISGAIPLEKSQQYFAGQTSKFFLNLADVQKEWFKVVDARPPAILLKFFSKVMTTSKALLMVVATYRKLRRSIKLFSLQTFWCIVFCSTLRFNHLAWCKYGSRRPRVESRENFFQNAAWWSILLEDMCHPGRWYDAK